MITEAELDELERLARRATPGVWDDTDELPWEGIWHVGPMSMMDREGDVVATLEAGRRDDARYIAAMHPEQALTLIAELREVGRLRAAERLAVELDRVEAGGAIIDIGHDCWVALEAWRAR